MSAVNELEKDVMKKHRKITASKICGSVLSIAFGLILLVWSNAAITVICKIFGAFLVIGGVVLIVSFLIDREGIRSILSVIGGAIAVVLGMYIFMKPETLAKFFAVILGVIILINGIIDIKEAITMAQRHYSKWYVSLIIGIVISVLGLLAIFRPMGLANLIVAFLGVVLILNGIFDIVVTGSSNRAAKDLYQAVHAVDTVGQEVDEEKN